MIDKYKGSKLLYDVLSYVFKNSEVLYLENGD